MTGGTGADTFGSANNFGTIGTSILASALSNAVLNAAVTVTFATGTAGNVDRVTDFVSGTDKLDVVNANTAPTTLINLAAGALTANTTYVVYGAYVAATGVFTAAAAYGAGNTDALVVTGDGVLSQTTTTGYQVLTGLNQALVAADFV